jgi:hypothetical protein
MFGRSGAKERVKQVDVGLQWDIGAPMPHLIQSESRTFLTFYLSDPRPDWDGTSVEILDPTSPSPVSLGVIQWLSCDGAVLGGPNDEAYRGHRLWERGLSEVGAYRAAEVLNSTWIAGLEEQNRVHPQHRSEAFVTYRHFILGFHDSTFECIARGFRTWKAEIAMPQMLAALAARLDEPGLESELAFDEVKRG